VIKGRLEGIKECDSVTLDKKSRILYLPKSFFTDGDGMHVAFICRLAEATNYQIKIIRGGELLIDHGSAEDV
jgi:hypothetical protein